MKHEYTDTELQSAIDGALKSHPFGTIVTREHDSNWLGEQIRRLAIIKSALAALPEPEPLTVDGKTPGQVAWDAGNEVQKRKFPNEPVMSWQEGDELHEQLEVAAAAVLAAFGNQSQAVEEANARAEKAEAELAAAKESIESQTRVYRKDTEFLEKKLHEAIIKPSLSQLRPLSEAGAVPEGCIRVYGYYHYNWSIGKELLTPDTHFADIRLPEPADKHPEPLVTKPISLPPTEGISLRDWFAGMALQGKATRLSNPHEHRDILSSDCYDVADAMLAAREVKP